MFLLANISYQLKNNHMLIAKPDTCFGNVVQMSNMCLETAIRVLPIMFNVIHNKIFTYIDLLDFVNYQLTRTTHTSERSCYRWLHILIVILTTTMVFQKLLNESAVVFDR